jgi:hypothetical protein
MPCKQFARQISPVTGRLQVQRARRHAGSRVRGRTRKLGTRQNLPLARSKATDQGQHAHMVAKSIDCGMPQVTLVKTFMYLRCLCFSTRIRQQMPLFSASSCCVKCRSLRSVTLLPCAVHPLHIDSCCSTLLQRWPLLLWGRGKPPPVVLPMSMLLLELWLKRLEWLGWPLLLLQGLQLLRWLQLS